MSILGQTGAKACRECGERARAERDRLMAENAKLREMIARTHRLLAYRCDAPHEAFHGKPCESCAEHGSEDCPKIIAEQMRELGIEMG